MSATAKVVVIDDDPLLLELVELELSSEGIEAVLARSAREGLRAIEEERPAAVVLDLLMPDVRGTELLAKLRQDLPDLPVVMLTAHGAVDDVVACMRLGAADYIQKPFDRIRLVTSIRNAITAGLLRARVASLADELHRGSGFASLLGRSQAMRSAIDLLSRAARSDVTVLLEGESGTGKEVAARAVHAESARRTGPFVAVNCGAIPEGLIESELFGHERGAFTGAVERRPGRFEQAEGGTLFLDEIGELRLDLQVRLLRALQERSITRVGGTRARSVDVRFIAASLRDLRAEVARGGFREDLFFRLAVFPVRLPPLRERGEDKLILAGTFLERFAARHARPARRLSPGARRAIEVHSWPGNVRELENAIERAVILEDGPEISAASLPDEVLCSLDPAGAVAKGAAREGASSLPEGAAGGREILPLDEEERRIIMRALKVTGWNLRETASRLAIGRATLYRKIERYGLALSRAATDPGSGPASAP